jgi:predicted GTPase
MYCGGIGQTGLGKSTLINTIFASHLIDSKGRLEAEEPVRQTTDIQAVSHGTLSQALVPEYPPNPVFTL